MKNMKKNWKSIMALLLSIVLTLTSIGIGGLNELFLGQAGVAYAAEEADENGFVIENGVLKKYTGTAAEVEIPEGITRIDPGVFKDCSSLTSISIPEGVTSIGGTAFEGCSNLTSISLPEGVTSIGILTFKDCSSLTSISIPEGITSIEERTFSGCSSLTGISIPEGVTSIGIRAFEGCSNLTSINIPEGVTSIGDYAFSGCSSLTSISIPEGVTSIEDHAFSDCNSLTSISLPEGITSIDWNAFSGCSGLTNIEIPNSVTSIGWSAFEGCSNLTSIRIPASVTKIVGGAFGGCGGLESIVVEEGNTVYDSREDCNAIICSETNELVAGCDKTVIPESITSIGSDAFSGRSGFTSINIPEGVEYIGSSAFSGCSKLASVSIPEGVKYLEYSVFSSCSKLMNIDIPESVICIRGDAFADCGELTSVSIPASVTSIEKGAFDGCNKLVISGKKGTRAQTYAEEYNIPFYLINSENNVIESGIRIESVEEAKAGEQVKIEVIANKDMYWSNFKLYLNLNPEKLKAEKEEIQAIEANYNSWKWQIWKGPSYTGPGLEGILVDNWLEEDYSYIVSGATYNIDKAYIQKDTVLLSLIAETKVDLKAGDIIATCELPNGYDDKNAGTEENEKRLSVDCMVEEMPINMNGFIIANGTLKKYTGKAAEVEIPEGVTKIDGGAFEDCSHVISIKIPKSVTKIEEDAFVGCSSALTIYGEEGSYAQEFANTNQIPFRLSGSEEDVISAEEMEKLVEKNRTEDVTVETASGVTFIFKKGSLDNAEIIDAIDFGAAINQDYTSLPKPSFAESEFAFQIDYNYEGELPGMAQISIPVDNKWIGKRLYYYEIGQNGEYKYMGRTTVAKDGTYTVTQNHCSSYVTTTKAPEKLGNCDGVDGVTSSDALAVLRYEVGITQTNFDARLADCDGEDGITSKDALAILRYEVGVIDKLY